MTKKLSLLDRAAIQTLRERGVAVNRLAAMYDVDPSTIWRVVDGKQPLEREPEEPVYLLNLVGLMKDLEPTFAPPELCIPVPLPRAIVDRLIQELAQIKGEDTEQLRRLLTKPPDKNRQK